MADHNKVHDIELDINTAHTEPYQRSIPTEDRDKYEKLNMISQQDDKGQVDNDLIEITTTESLTEKCLTKLMDCVYWLYDHVKECCDPHTLQSMAITAPGMELGHLNVSHIYSDNKYDHKDN